MIRRNERAVPQPADYAFTGKYRSEDLSYLGYTLA